MTLTKEQIDLAEEEFVLCWRDQIKEGGFAVYAPVAFGHEHTWKAICEAARRGIEQTPKRSWGDGTTYWSDGALETPKGDRIEGLEEAARFVEENYEEPFVNIVGNPSWRERGPKKLAAAVRALKDKP